MTTHGPPELSPELSPERAGARAGDRWAIHDLVVAYAYAVDAHDWTRFESLFCADADIDYRSAGGIAGTPAEVAAWMPDAMGLFEFSMHSMSTHAVEFDTDDETLACGSLHVFARHGLTFEGVDEFMDVGAVYEDRYRRTSDGWRFAARTEHTRYITGGRFADAAAAAAGLAR